jgi:cyclic pyranopterin phosphate synthase
MVDVSGKPITRREATASGAVRMSAEAFGLVRDNAIAKGDVLAVARLAGIGAAKRTAELIPQCHPLPLDGIEVELELDETLPGVRVEATTRVEARTGVEMEALTAVSVACLTVYDMVKAVDRGIRIEDIGLVRKSGGRSGDWTAASAAQTKEGKR